MTSIISLIWKSNKNYTKLNIQGGKKKKKKKVLVTCVCVCYCACLILYWCRREGGRSGQFYKGGDVQVKIVLGTEQVLLYNAQLLSVQLSATKKYFIPNV